jgi:hypothetical protein
MVKKMRVYSKPQLAPRSEYQEITNLPEQEKRKIQLENALQGQKNIEVENQAKNVLRARKAEELVLNQQKPVPVEQGKTPQTVLTPSTPSAVRPAENVLPPAPSILPTQQPQSIMTAQQPMTDKQASEAGVSKVTGGIASFILDPLGSTAADTENLKQAAMGTPLAGFSNALDIFIDGQRAAVSRFSKYVFKIRIAGFGVGAVREKEIREQLATQQQVLSENTNKLNLINAAIKDGYSSTALISQRNKLIQQIRDAANLTHELSLDPLAFLSEDVQNELIEFENFETITLPLIDYEWNTAMQQNQINEQQNQINQARFNAGLQ